MANEENGIPMDILALQLKSMLNAGAIYKEEKSALCEEVDKMYGMQLSPEYFASLLPQFLSEVRIKRLIKKYKPGSSQEFASEIGRVIETTQPDDDGCVVVQPLIDLQMSTEPVQVVPCGITAIDSRMGGGLGKSELGVICGISGLGKTTLAVNFAWGASAFHKAALVTLELPQKKISERLYSRVTQIPYDRIRKGDNGDMTEVRRQVREGMELYPVERLQNFVIWDYSAKPCSLKTLDRRLAQCAEEGNLPDMLFLDWLDALETDPSERQNGFVAKELRHVLQNYSRGCSDLAKKYNVAFWATTQSNASGEGKRKIRMSNSSEGFGKSWRCSAFLGIGASDEDRESGRLTVTAAKMRDGAIFETQIQARLDVQTFEDIPPDSDFVSPELSNFQVSRPATNA